MNGYVGNGRKIHKLNQHNQTICGAGLSTHAHNFRSNKSYRTTEEPVTCERCLQIMNVLIETIPVIASETETKVGDKVSVKLASGQVYQGMLESIDKRGRFGVVLFDDSTIRASYLLTRIQKVTKND